MPKKSSAQPRPNLKVPPRGIGPISELNKNDVLSGRGGRINAHDGNIRFREICQDHKKDYLAPTTKKLEKAHIAAGIVDSIRTMDPPGRFLKEDPDGTWWDIGDFKAIKKVGQALREDAPEIRTENRGDSSDDDDPKLVNQTSYVSPNGIPTSFNTQLPIGERSPGLMPPPSQVPSTVASSVQKQYTIGESGPVFHDYSGQAAQLASQQPMNTLQNFQNDQYSQYEHQQSQQTPNIYNARQMYQGTLNEFNKALPENASNRQVAFGREFVPTGSSATTLTVSTVSGLSDPSKLLNTGETSNFSGAPAAMQARAPAATAVAAAAVASQAEQSMGGVPVLPTGLHNAVSMGTGEDLIRSQQEKINGRTVRDSNRNSIHYQQLANDPRRLSSLSGMSDLTLSIMSLDQSFGLTRSNSNPDLTQSLRNLFQRESSNKSISDATVDALASEDHLMQDSWNQLGTSGNPAELVNFVTGSNRTMITKESGGSGNSNDTSLGTSSASAQSNAVPSVARRPSFSRFRATSTGSTTGMSIGSQQSLFSKTSDASWRVNAQLLAAQGDDGSVKSIMSELSADIMALDLADPYRRGPAFG